MDKTTNAEVLKAFSIAIETELRGLEAYLKFARATKDATGKNMFIILAQDEVEHYRILERAMREMEIHGNVQEVKIADSIMERVSPKLKERDERIKGEAGTDQISALNAALEQERKSVELYRAQLGKAISPEARKLFTKLMEMEEAHYDIIQAELHSINESGFWFQIPEFDLED